MNRLFEKIGYVIEKNSNEIFIIEEDKKISFERFKNDILHLKYSFKEIGFEKGDRVCLIISNTYEFVLSYFALLFSGIIPVPINFFDKWQVINYKINFMEAKGLIYWNYFDTKVESILQEYKMDLKLISFGETALNDTIEFSSLVTGNMDEKIFDDIDEEENALILFSSGISGKSKAAVFTYKSICKAVDIFNEFFCLNKAEKILAAVPFFHPMAQSMILFPAICKCSQLILHSRFEEEQIFNSIREEKITIFPATYTMLKSIAEKTNDMEPFSHQLRLIISSGGEIQKEECEKIEKYFNAKILESYGSTETLFLATCTRLYDLKEKDMYGVPLNGISVKTFDGNGCETELGYEGEIAVKSEHLFKEYWNNPELTENFKKDGWFFTEDIGKLNDCHFLYFYEKIDEVIFKGGFPVYPREVEEELLKHDKIKEVAVAAVYDEELEQEVKAFITLNENIRVDPEEIFSFIREKLPLYKCPKYLKFTPVLPKNSTGKILKRFLKSRKFQ